MHKVKKAAQLLRDYLGKDAHGIKLLDAVATIANDLRKQLAASKEAEVNAAAAADSNRIELVHARNDIQQHKQLVISERAKQRQSANEVAVLRERVKELEREREESIVDMEQPERSASKRKPGLGHALHDSTVFPARLANLKEFTESFNILRKAMRIAPRPNIGTQSTGIRDDCYVYNLPDLIQSYSPDEMMKIGRFVTSLAMMGVPAIIASSPCLVNWEVGGNVLPENAQAKFVSWYRNNIDHRNTLHTQQNGILGGRREQVINQWFGTSSGW